jgi:flavin-dependent dehydrogenase
MSNCNRKVCVVGGGPAGLAAAIALRRENCDVTVVDCAVPPIDKACGEGLMPDSMAALGELGIEIPADVGFAFRGIRFADARSSVFADFPAGIAKGLRRTALHELMIRHAVSQGVSIVWNAKHVRLAGGGISVDRQLIQAQLVVGADGQNSQIRRQAALHGVTREKRRYGFRRHYRITPWSSYMELHWGTNSQVYITPIAPDEICVVTISRDPKLRWEQVLCGFPDLNRRLRDIAPVSPEMGALSVSRSLQRVQRDNVALIGDASGSVDAITGEGMRLGFRQALALAAALRSGDIRQYQRLHTALMKRPQMIASLLLSLERNGQFQSRVLAGLARHPDIFESLLAIHVGASSFRNLCSWRLLDFGRVLLTA